VTKVFRLNDNMYRQLMFVLNAEMDRGLKVDSHQDATVKMFHTYVRALPNGSGLCQPLSYAASTRLSHTVSNQNARSSFRE